MSYLENILLYFKTQYIYKTVENFKYISLTYKVST